MKIIYKVVNSLAVLSVIPSLLFLPMFRFIATVDMASGNVISGLVGLIGSALGSSFDINSIIAKVTGINIENLPEFYTIPEVLEMFTGENSNGAFAEFDTSVIPEIIKIFFTAAIILFALAIVFAFVTFITGLFSKKLTIPLIFSVCGIASAFGANYSFKYVADQIVSGKISVIEILKGIPALAEYESYLEYLSFDVRIFELSTAYTTLLLIFGVLIILNISFKLAFSTQNN